MPWVPKPGAPDSFNLAEEFAALITGDATWGWLVDWIPMITNMGANTADFCSAGPPGGDLLTAEDFMSLMLTTQGDFSRAVMLGGLLGHVATDRVFQAFCESTSTTVGWCDLVDVSWPVTGDQTWCLNGTRPNVYTWLTVVPGTQVRISISGPGSPNLFWSHPVNGPDIINTTAGNDVPQVWTVPAGKTYLGAAFRHTGTNYTGRFHVEEACDIPDQYTATPQPQPSGVLPPAQRTYTTIAELGAELDRQEFKLDFLLANARFQASHTTVPPAAPEDPIEVVEDEPIDLVGAIGVIVTLAAIPPGANEEFGEPVRLHRVGRVTLGTSDGWLPSFNLEHSPLLIMPIPSGVTRVQVSTNPPVTSTVRLLKPAK